MRRVDPGIYPFWFWNDHLDHDEIRWQIAEMSAQGVHGFFLHPRQGLGQPYLSESFFSCVRVAIEAAESHGMIVHLYDEYPYPSGVAGGEVVSGRPEYRATRLIQRAYDVSGGLVRLQFPKGHILGVTAHRITDGSPDWADGSPDWVGGIDLRSHTGMSLDQESYNETGLTAYNQKRYFASDPTPTLEVELPEGRYRIYASVQAEVSRHKYWDHFVDVLNPDAVRRFLMLTHERYRERFGDKFGQSIASIFVDETRPGWSTRIPKAFQDRYDYDLLSHLVALQDSEHPDHLRVSFDLYNLRYELFCESFETPIATWCEQHGLGYSGEKHALRFDQMRYQDVPGCDPGHTKVGARSDMYDGDARRNARATASGAYFYDKQGALCECYHSMGWSATLQDAKLVGEELLLNGISYLVPHGFFYTTHGLKKHDAPPTFFFQMPYWQFFGRLSDRFACIWEQFPNTWIDAHVLLIEPESGMPSKRDHEIYTETQFALLSRHLEFLMADVEVLRGGTITQGELRIKDLTISSIVVTPTRMMRPELAEWLKEAEAQGLDIVRVDRNSDPTKVISSIATGSEEALAITASNDAHRDVRIVRRRRQDGSCVYFLINTSGSNVDLKITSPERLHEVTLDDAFAPGLSRTSAGYARSVAPFESFMLQSTETDRREDRVPRITVAVPTDCDVRPLGKNLLRMDPWTLAVGRDGETESETASVNAQPILNQLMKSGLPLRPDYKTYFGSQPEIQLPELDLRYQYEFDCNYSGEIGLVYEPGSIRGDWSIDVNGEMIHEGDFEGTDAHVRGSMGCRITDAISRGSNRVTVNIRTDRMDGGLLNPLYLAGAFGVSLDPVALKERSSQGVFEAYRLNGLPHYSGTVEYVSHFEIPAPLPDSREVILRLAYGFPFHEATEVAINDGTFEAVLWEPRVLRVDREQLKSGQNTLKMRVHTSLIRSFEGTWFDYDRHVYRDVSEGP